MVRRFPFLLLASVLTLLLTGCAGNEIGIDPPVKPSGIAFVASPVYNGSTDLLVQDSLDGTSTGTQTSAVIEARGRKLELVLPTITPKTGDVFTLGQNGASASYSETGSRRWIASGGTLTVTADDANNFHAGLAGAIFAPESATGAAKGTFTASGPLFLGYGVNQGPGTLTFTADPALSTNAILQGFGPAGGATFSDTYTLSIRMGSETSGGGLRELSLSLPKETPVGATGTFRVDGSSHMNYSEERGEIVRIWYSTGGTWRLVSRTRSNIEIAVTDVVMTPDNEQNLASTAKGTFRLDGTLKR